MNDIDNHLCNLVAKNYRGDVLAARTRTPLEEHLANCPTMTADASAREGSYGCDTGCEYVRLEADISCECEEFGTDEYNYGTFGDIASLIEDLDEEVKKYEALNQS